MRRKLRFGILGCFASIMMAGCGTEEVALYESSTSETVDNIVVLAGNHANSLKQDYATMDDMLMEVALNYGNITICVTDGDSYIASSIEIPEQKHGLSNNKRNSIAQRQADQVLDFLYSEDCMAKTDEVDLLKSFEIASRTIHSSTYQNEANVIYVYDTGINTTGCLNFTELDLATVDANEVVDKLVEEDLVVDFTGTTVYWYGLCDTVAPQEDLSASQKENVKRIWERYLSDAGATVYFMTDISTEELEQELPYVTPVASAATSYEWNFPEAVVFDEETIGFCAGTAELVDVKRSEEELQNVVDYMNANKDFQLLVVGCTARWGDLEEYCRPLSLERCKVVMDLLVGAGVSEERIEICGMGYENPFYTNDQDADGTLVEESAEDNRCIVLLDATSDLAMKIKENTWKE